MAKKAEVDQSLCIGCGLCVSTCPMCFELGSNGKSHFKKGCDASKCDLDEIATDCPAQAISVE
jgi:ferredoxin